MLTLKRKEEEKEIKINKNLYEKQRKKKTTKIKM